LRKGGAFEELAKKSKDPGSAARGGDLDWASPDSYVKPFSEALVKLEKGKLTEVPVKSDFGWHIIRLDDVRDTQPPPLEQVKPQIQQELERRLDDLQKEHIDGHLITLNRLDYGLDLDTLARQLANRWAGEAQDSSEQLVVAIDGQTITAAVAASDDLLDQLPASLLSSVGSTTMAVPLRQGARYRQASLDALDRLETVLLGGEDPGPPLIQDDQVALTNVPTKEETSESNAFTWVAVLLIVGTVVPMLTWWVFSR
jgi:uncharacterized protein